MPSAKITLFKQIMLVKKKSLKCTSYDNTILESLALPQAF